jgi:hypothetical protein
MLSGLGREASRACPHNARPCTRDPLALKRLRMMPAEKMTLEERVSQEDSRPPRTVKETCWGAGRLGSVPTKY